MMKKIAYLLFGAFIMMPCFNAYAYDFPMDTKNTPLGINDKMEVSWKELAKPLRNMFPRKDDQSWFFTVMDDKYYDEQRNLLIVSIYDLYATCSLAASTMLGTIEPPTEEYYKKCANFAIKVAENVLNTEKRKKAKSNTDN